MRVLHAHSGNLYGGVERLISALVQHDRSVDGGDEFLLCFEGRLASELRHLGARVAVTAPVRLSQPWAVRRARRALHESLRRRRPDAVVCHSHWGLAVFGPEVRAAGVPLVLWLHGAPTGKHWLERLGFRVRPAGVLCTSRFVANAVSRLYPDLPKATVHPPVTPPISCPVEQRDEVRRAFGAEPNDTVVLQVGRMEHGKGHLVFLRAFAELCADKGRWRGWQVGGADGRAGRRYLAGLRQTADRLGISSRLAFLGAQSDTSALFAAADVYCQPNVLPEAFGITFVEALYAGLPVVTTAIGGAVEIVDHDCGVLLPDVAPAAFAAAIRAVTADPARRAAARSAGPVRARSLCDPAQQVPAARSALADLIAGSRPG